MDNECYDQITVFWWQSNGIKLDRLISSGFQSPAEAFSSRLSKDGFLIGPNLSRLYEYTTILVHSRCLNNHQFWMNTQRWLISILSKIWMSNIFCGHHFFNSVLALGTFQVHQCKLWMPREVLFQLPVLSSPVKLSKILKMWLSESVTFCLATAISRTCLWRTHTL